ncbi:MAG: glycosyl hydrolase, partial [Kiritimatiellaeota bacterium]|nr:glycosyl hydrolase [Kiritimatiellota bacterium]
MAMKHGRILIAVLTGLLTANVTHAGDSLAQQFAAPPASARPWVYAFIVDGNLSKEGITADLEALKRAGIGGLLVFDGTQQMPPGPARFMSPLWLDLFKHLVAEAKRLGLELSMNNDAGWAGSGGPWNTPENSCQRVVWTTMQVTGPKQLDVPVEQPATKLNYYRDIALLAFPTAKGDGEGKGYRIEQYGSTKSYGG